MLPSVCTVVHAVQTSAAAKNLQHCSACAAGCREYASWPGDLLHHIRHQQHHNSADPNCAYQACQMCPTCASSSSPKSMASQSRASASALNSGSSAQKRNFSIVLMQSKRRCLDKAMADPMAHRLRRVLLAANEMQAWASPLSCKRHMQAQVPDLSQDWPPAAAQECCKPGMAPTPQQKGLPTSPGY